MGGSIFIDTNVLVYANNILSPLCAIARQKLQDAVDQYDSVWVSRQIFREFASVVSREMLVSGRVDFVQLEQAILQFELDFFVAENSPSATRRWLQLLGETQSSGKQVHDANIVALMLTNNIQSILTHNTADFQRFSHLVSVIPLI